MSNNIRILIVEDDHIIREILQESLTDSGYQVTDIESADLAIKMIEDSFEFDVLITDINMPGVHNGIYLTEYTRKHLPDMPIMFITGSPDRLCSLMPLRKNEAIVLKPFRMLGVEKTLSNLLA